jgi:hypothetical protein
LNPDLEVLEKRVSAKDRKREIHPAGRNKELRPGDACAPPSHWQLDRERGSPRGVRASKDPQLRVGRSRQDAKAPSDPG